MATKRGNPTARVGNYAQKVDTLGMDPEMKEQMLGTKMDKTEKNYAKGGSPNAREAIKRARKANKQPPLRPEE